MFNAIIAFIKKMEQEEKYFRRVLKYFKDEQREFIERNNDYVTFFLLMHNLKQKESPKMKDRKKIDILIDEGIESLKINNIIIEVDETSKRIHINSEKSKKGFNGFSIFKAESLLKEMSVLDNILLRSSFINIITSVEYFIACIIQYMLSNNPKNFDKVASKISLSQLDSYENVQEIKDLVIEENIEMITRGSFLDWIKFLKDNKVIVGLEKKDIDTIYEGFLRRNLFIHNNGMVNQQYLTKAPKGKHKFIKGELAQLTPDYILYLVDVAKKSMISVALDVWSKVKRVDIERDNDIVEIIYLLLSNEDYDCARIVAEKYIQLERIIDDECKIYMEINRYIAIKAIGCDWDAEKLKLQNRSFLSYSDILKMAKHALLDEYKSVNELFAQLKEEKEINYVKICTFPVFKWYRQSAEFKELLDNDNGLNRFYNDIFENEETNGILFNDFIKSMSNDYRDT